MTEEDETMKDKSLGKINMYDLFLSLVSEESGTESHTLHT